MDAVTYPNDDVQALLDERAVPYKPQIDENKDFAKRMGVVWTPGLLWLTPEGDLAHSNVGYFEPDEFQAELVYGFGKVAAAQRAWNAARRSFDEVADRWPQSFAAPAALYWAGVAGKNATDDVGPLKTAWNRLLDVHPESAWAMKVSFLRGK
jgi:hypothetical protein